MDEYIGRAAAIEAAKHAWAKGLEPSQYIEALPAADVAPVVRTPGGRILAGMSGVALRAALSSPLRAVGISLLKNTARIAGPKWTARERTARMAKQSAYLQRRDAELNAAFNAGAAMAAQFAVDTLQMTMHQKEGWGYDRIMRVTHEWMETQREYRPALNCKDPEADARQVHMDRVLAEIINGKAELIPFPDRYPNAKKIKYGR